MDQLLKEIEEDRATLSALADLGEDELEEEIEEEIEETPEEEAVEDVEEPAEPEYPKKEEPKEELDASGYARLRREKQMEKDRAEKLERELAEIRAQLNKTKEDVEESSEPSLPPELAEVVENQRFGRAAQEFERMQAEFSQGLDDFADVSSQYHAAIAQSIAIQNPDMSSTQIQQEAVKTILRKAGQYLNAGYNPVEKMYLDAKKLGFKALPKESEAEPQKEIKPDLSKVAANRQRNAGTVASPGAGGGAKLTRETIANLSPEEYLKLPREEREKALRSA